jgi:hypothetical protein
MVSAITISLTTCPRKVNVKSAWYGCEEILEGYRVRLINRGRMNAAWEQKGEAALRRPRGRRVALNPLTGDPAGGVVAGRTSVR